MGKKISLNDPSYKIVNYPRPSLVYLLVSYLVVWPLFRLFFRGRVYGISNVPSSGPLVVVSNHGSHLDPPLLGHALGRPVAFMAKAELFRIPLLGKIIHACGAYPVKRGASDRAAIRVPTSKLNEGWAIGVFLDGTRQENGMVNSPLPGAAFLAARTGAKILPVAVVNSHKALPAKIAFPRFCQIKLRVGLPVSAPTSRTKKSLEITTELLQQSINSMLENS